MKSTKAFNNISDKLKAQIPKLKKDQRVSFQMLNGVPNPEPDERERRKQGETLYGKVQLMTTFRIFDPYLKDAEGNEVGGYVDVGCVDQWNGDQPAKFRMFMPGITPVHLHNLAFGGRFDLVGGNVKDEELYEILWLSPEREGSPCADQSFEIKFKIIDEKAGVKSSVNKFDRLKKAIAIVDGMSKQEASSIMAALNQPKYQDESILMSKMKEYAMTNVDTFLNTYESKDTPIRATLKKALEERVLEYELKTGSIKVGGATVATIKVDNEEAFVDSFVQWIRTSGNGQDVFNNIKNQLETKEAVV